jgi:beta-lactamase class C
LKACLNEIALFHFFHEVFLLIAAPVSYAKAAFPSTLQTYITQIELEKVKLQGGAIAVFYKGQVVYQKTFRYPKDDTGNITPKSLFSLALLSKLVAVLCVVFLLHSGRISYDQKSPHLV